MFFRNNQIQKTIIRFLIKGELTKYLLSVQREAENMIELFVSQMTKFEGVTEKLKLPDQMKQGGLVRNIHNLSEEVVIQEIVFV